MSKRILTIGVALVAAAVMSMLRRDAAAWGRRRWTWAVAVAATVVEGGTAEAAVTSGAAGAAISEVAGVTLAAGEHTSAAAADTWVAADFGVATSVAPGVRWACRVEHSVAAAWGGGGFRSGGFAG